MPSRHKSPLFFRYTYIISGKGYRKNKKYFFNIQGIYFGFWSAKQYRKDMVIDEVKEYARIAMERMGNVTLFQDGESETTRKPFNVRLYFKKIYINEKLVHKEDIKY